MSLDEFAKAIDVGRSTLVRTEAGSRTPNDSELQRIAKVSGLPVGFFKADLEAVLAGHEEPGITDRVADLEAQVTELRAGLATLAADNLRRAAERSAQDETGRRRQGRGGSA